MTRWAFLCALALVAGLAPSFGQTDLTVVTLNPGNYELRAQKEGFHTFCQTGIVLQVGQTLRSDFRLEVGAVTETVSVTAEVAPLNSENGAVPQLQRNGGGVPAGRPGQRTGRPAGDAVRATL